MDAHRKQTGKKGVVRRAHVAALALLMALSGMAASTRVRAQEEDPATRKTSKNQKTDKQKPPPAAQPPRNASGTIETPRPAVDPGKGGQPRPGERGATAPGGGGDRSNPFALAAGANPLDPNTKIRQGFDLNVTVVGEPEPSARYTVDASGNVLIKYAGIATAVTVKGLTPTEAGEAIARFLRTYIKNPQVTVTIVSIPQPIVWVSGAVKTPGIQKITPDTTLVDVLSQAEWLETANLSEVRITRISEVDGKEVRNTVVVPFGRYIKVVGTSGEIPDEADNPTLADHDRIFVPYGVTPGYYEPVVSLFGEVAKQTPNFVLRERPVMTLREVISANGGLGGAANRKQVVVRRFGVERPLVVDFDKAELGDPVHNIEMRPDDAIYVERLETNAFVNLNGGFVTPGKFVLDKRTTLTQAVMEAGGIAPFSHDRDCRLFRHPDNDPKHTQIVKFSWDAIQKGKMPDLELLPGDSIYVPPGTAPKQISFESVLGTLTSVVFLYSGLTGNGFVQ